MNKKEVTITYTSHMYDTDDHVNTTAKGIFGIKDGVYIVMYSEENEGMEPTRTVLKFNKDFLDVTKMGAMKSKMHYERGYTHNSIYYTFFGNCDMCIKTEEYILEEIDNGYKITTLYNLEMNGNFMSRCKVEIVISEISR